MNINNYPSQLSSQEGPRSVYGNPGNSVMTMKITKESEELLNDIHIANEYQQLSFSIKLPKKVPEACMVSRAIM